MHRVGRVCEILRIMLHIQAARSPPHGSIVDCWAS